MYRVFLCGLFTLFLWIMTYGYVHAQQHRPATNYILRIIDQDSGEPVDAAFVYVAKQYFTPDKYGDIVIPTSTKLSGNFEIRCLGYTSVMMSVTAVTPGKVCTVRMSANFNKLKEVIVSSDKAPITVNAVHKRITSSQIDKALGKTLASLLEQVSGVSSIQTGTTIAKPVIQGMYGNRILIINNGVRQAGQQWGDDHAPELDMNTSGSIEVVKGADAVRYGAEALGGVVVMNNRLLPYRLQDVHGKVSSLYGSNGHRYVLSGYVEGAVPFARDFAWNIQGTYINGGDRATANYLLNNTGVREKNFSVSLGMDKYRYGVEAYYSRYDSETGVMLSAQLGDIDLLKERIAIGYPVQVDPYTRKIIIPKQHVVHHLVYGKAYYESDNWGKLSWQISYQADRRNEYHIRRNNLSHVPGLSLRLNSLQNQVRWDLDHASWHTRIGAQSIYLNNSNRPGTGVVPVIPNYTEWGWGIYSIQKYSSGRWNVEAGARLDFQDTRADGFDAYGRRYGGHRRFSNFTYSLGTRYVLSSRWSLTSNMGVAWRAPHVHELYSNGLEHGSGMYMVGDSTLRSEQSYKWITSLAYRSDQLRIMLDGYVQWINNYIYDEPTTQIMTVVSGAYPVFRYKQTKALFRGLDLDLTWDIASQWSYHMISSFIWANESATHNYLPYIPAPKLDHSLTWHLPWRLKGESPYITVHHRFVAKQTRFDPRTDLIPYSPPSYHLLGMEAGCQWQLPHHSKVKVLISADNLLNKQYKEYTNRSRYYAHDMGRDVRVAINWIF